MSQEKSEESGLNDSWVDVHHSFIAKENPMDQSSSSFEQLLREAQKESGLTSRNSSQGSGHSPKNLHSPPLSAVSGSTGDFLRPKIDIPQQQINDWIWDWSSRPEVVPPSDYENKFVHPVKKYPLSLRNTKVIKNSIFSTENLPTLFFTHACSFLVGAALVLVYLKRYSATVKT